MDQNNTELLFMQLIMQNRQIALMSMGKIENPLSHKTEINLDFAKHAIATLDMIKEKTKGNLTPYEDKYLNETLSELKLNYVQESKG